MTTVSCNVPSAFCRMQVSGLLRWAVMVCFVSGPTAAAQSPPKHWLHAGATPPGAIGSQRLARGGPLSGYFQPVRIRAPQGARIALAEEGGFGAPQWDEVLVGMQIGPVYRMRVSDLPADPGQEVFPTVEVIDRLYPPEGLSQRYPIEVELTEDELDMAARGMFVTRIIYLEDPFQALPVSYEETEGQPWVEAPHGTDPLVIADELGRPVAILRIGNRIPTRSNIDDYVAPPLIHYGGDATLKQTFRHGPTLAPLHE